LTNEDIEKSKPNYIKF